MRKQSALVILLISFITSVSYAQSISGIYGPYDSIQIKEYGRIKTLAWAGGLNSPQFTMGDLNNDKIKDLVIFDPAQGVKTFINTGRVGTPNYVYSPKYEVNFPRDLQIYVVLADYDRDGIPDMFHRGSAGISAYKGYYNSNNELCFTFYKEIYYHHPVIGWVNAYVEPSDKPSILDFDGDGDIDFLTYGQGGIHITYFRNCQVEEGLPKDSIKLCVKDMHWGRVAQTGYRAHMLEDKYTGDDWLTTCKGCVDTSGNKATHSGNSLTLVDYDGDGDYDFFDGNVSFPDVQFLKNGRIETGHSIDTMIAQDTIWQGNGRPVQLNIFPSCFWEDIDQDGDNDLMFAPHAQNSQDYKNVFYYKNTGSNSSPNFVFQSDSFLVDQMIDLGSGSHPTLYDYNKDGKLDLIVGSDGFFDFNGNIKSRLYYYENTSTGSNTSFELKNDNLLSLFGQNIQGAAPSIGDVDNDGKDDMLIGLANGTFMLFKNTAASNTVQPQWGTTGTLLNDGSGTMDVGTFATPFIYDINKDGIKDILAGNELGYLYYYKGGVASPGTYAYTKETNMLGGIKIAQYGQGAPRSVPFIGKIDNTGNEYLLVGTANGSICRYDGFQSGDTKGPYVRLDSNYAKLTPDYRSSPVVADIDGKGKYLLISGSQQGGLRLYKQYVNVGINDLELANKNISVYPNPGSNSVNISWNETFAQSGEIQVAIINTAGQTVFMNTVNAEKKMLHVNTQSFTAGFYYCIVQGTGGQRETSTISIIK